MEPIALDLKYLLNEKARLEKERVIALGKLNTIFGALQQVENMISILESCEKIRKAKEQLEKMENVISIPEAKDGAPPAAELEQETK